MRSQSQRAQLGIGSQTLRSWSLLVAWIFLVAMAVCEPLFAQIPREKAPLTTPQLHGQVDEEDAEALYDLLVFLHHGDMDAILNYLKEEKNIKTKEDDEPLSKKLIVYLYFYFGLMDPDYEGTIYLRPVEGRSGAERPDLVFRRDRADGAHLFFRPNADDRLFLTELDEAYAEQKTNPQVSLDSPAPSSSLTTESAHLTRLIVNFNNTLFEQLTEAIADERSIQRLIERTYNVRLTAPPKDRHHDVAYSFARDELVILLKLLTDLSKPVVRAMSLRQMVRLRPGYVIKKDEISLPEEVVDQSGVVAAYYDANTETIYFADAAFKNGRFLGEGTVLHDLGHALWKELDLRLKEEFIGLSWEWPEESGATLWDIYRGTGRKGGPKWELRAGIRPTDFVSMDPRQEGELRDDPYSMTNPAEDFAEHFAAYVRRPELLKTQTSEIEAETSKKYDYFRQRIFPRTRYETGGYRHHSTHLMTDEEPDERGPYLMGKVEDAVNITVEVNEKEDAYLDFVCTVSGIFDDLSGVAWICLELRSPMGLPGRRGLEKFSLSKDSDCMDEEQGIYRSCRTKLRRDFRESEYEIVTFFAGDMSGKKSYFDTSGLQNIFVPGTYEPKIEPIEEDPREPRPKEHPLDAIELQQQIAIQSLGELHADLGEGFELFLPVALSDDLRFLTFSVLLPEDDGQVLMYGVWNKQSLERSIRAVDSEHMAMRFVLPKKVRSRQAKLLKVWLSYNKTEELRDESYDIELPSDLANLTFDITRREPDTTPPELNWDYIQYGWEKVERNRNNGTNNRIVVVPIENIEPQHVSIVKMSMVRVKDGAILNGNLVSSNDSGRFRNFVFRFPLPPHAQLDYLTHEIEITEKPDHVEIPREEWPTGVLESGGFYSWKKTFRATSIDVEREVFVGTQDPEAPPIPVNRDR